MIEFLCRLQFMITIKRQFLDTRKNGYISQIDPHEAFKTWRLHCDYPAKYGNN